MERDPNWDQNESICGNIQTGTLVDPWKPQPGNNLINLPNVGVPTETDRGDEEGNGKTTGDLIKIRLAKSIIISSRRSLGLPDIVPGFVWPSTRGSWGQVRIQSN